MTTDTITMNPAPIATSVARTQASPEVQVLEQILKNLKDQGYTIKKHPIGHTILPTGNEHFTITRTAVRTAIGLADPNHTHFTTSLGGTADKPFVVITATKDQVVKPRPDGEATARKLAAPEAQT